MHIEVNSTATEALYNWVAEGQKTIGINLSDDLQAFVVYALLRNIDNTQLKEFVFAETLLSAMNNGGVYHYEKVLDHALIYGGMFPERVKKSGLSSAYYCDVGVMASEYLAMHYAKHKSAYELMYQNISKQFALLINLLRSMVPIKCFHVT